MVVSPVDISPTHLALCAPPPHAPIFICVTANTKHSHLKRSKRYNITATTCTERPTSNHSVLWKGCMNESRVLRGISYIQEGEEKSIGACQMESFKKPNLHSHLLYRPLHFPVVGVIAA